MFQRAEVGEKVDVESARQTIDFFRNFADRCHHGKEEACLFPLLEQKGFSRDQGPTGAMLHEHEEGRRHVRVMDQAASAIAAGDSAATADFVSHARAFTQLLREHILKEDHCLFQMADRALSEQDQSRLLESFAHVEHEDMGPGTHEKYLNIAAELAKRYGVICGVSDKSTDSPCCDHQ